MSSSLILLIIGGYFTLLMVVSRITSKKAGTESYFHGDRSSHWLLVSFGMIGSGISAVSLVSIPGNVGNENLFYFQFIMGSLAGYWFIAFILTPVFHRLRLVSIYSYLGERFGPVTYQTGSAIFMVSQSFGAALRLLLSVHIFQDAFFGPLGIPPFVTIALFLLLIWLYTHRAGVKTIVWTDALQSFFLIAVVVALVLTIRESLGIKTADLWSVIAESPKFRFFDWEPVSGTYFFKQFISGFLITVALVGLDQSMMQKTLTIASEKKAKNNVLSFSLFLAFAQTLFLFLGILLFHFADQTGLLQISADGTIADTDKILPMLTLNHFGVAGAVAFFIGVTASTFATVDSCITALTTSFSYDFLKLHDRPEQDRRPLRNKVLLGVNIVLFFIVLAFWNSGGAVINTIFIIAGYTYGPLLGIYLLGLSGGVLLREKLVPYMCLAAIAITWAINWWSASVFGFDMGFMNILVNALTTVFLLLLIRKSVPHV